MSDETPTTRPGSQPDLARRMDRMEARQDSMETEVRTLTATTARVEQNQMHAVELNRLRFDSLDTGLKSLSGQVVDFIKRFDGILSGEVETVQTRQGQQIVAEYTAWRTQTEDRMKALENSREREQGVFLALGSGKAVLLAIAACAGPVIAVASLLLK